MPTFVMSGERGPGRVLVRFTDPGVRVVTLRVRDRAGNRGESAPLTIRVPTDAEAGRCPGGDPAGHRRGRGGRPDRT